MHRLLTALLVAQAAAARGAAPDAASVPARAPRAASGSGSLYAGARPASVDTNDKAPHTGGGSAAAAQVAQPTGSPPVHAAASTPPPAAHAQDPAPARSEPVTAAVDTLMSGNASAGANGTASTASAAGSGSAGLTSGSALTTILTAAGGEGTSFSACGSATGIKRYDKHPICIAVGDEYMVLDPPTDVPSGVAVAGSAAAGATTVRVAVGTYASEPRLLSAPPASRGGETMFITPYTVVIHLDRGAVTGLTWDDGCFFCDSGSDACVANSPGSGTSGSDSNGTAAVVTKSCAMPQSQCGAGATAAASVPDGSGGSGNATTAGTAATVSTPQDGCDAKIFIVWTGTDASGAYLRSAGRRFSMYRKYKAGLAGLWANVKSKAGEVFQDV